MTSRRTLNERIHDGLHTFGARLQTKEGRVAILKSLLRLARRLVRWGTLAYLAVLLLVCALMSFVGERNIFFAFCLYLPPLAWFLPAFALLPLCLLVLEWRGLLAGALGITVALVGFLGFKPALTVPVIPPPDHRPPNSLVVLTNNRGQHDNKSMKPFKNQVMPDIMVFQEAAGVSARYLADPAYSEFKFGRDYSEFAIVSRHPVLSMEPVLATVQAPATTGGHEPPKTLQQVIATRCVIDFAGRQVILYNVHLPSPRETLRSFFRGSFLYGLIGLPGTAWGQKRALNQQGWDMRTEMVRQLVARASTEKDPVVLAGDFNMPAPGWNHRLVAGAFQDAHHKAGAGFGFTFPGVTRNPLSLGGPWMRIDYVFAGKGSWDVMAAVAEPDRASQHRATAALLVLK